MPTTPQDRKPKKVTKYTFTTGGKTYSLPLASKGAENVSGRMMRDSLLGGDEGEMKLGFALLEACGADQAVIDVIYDLPVTKCLEILGDWLKLGDGDGASLPQS
jgi:hypothetical protein